MSQTVQPGQVWADNDSRNSGRTIEVLGIRGNYVDCRVLTNDTHTQEILDDVERRGRAKVYAMHGGYIPKDRRGATTRIRLDRFRPTSTGYRLVHLIVREKDGITYEEHL